MNAGSEVSKAINDRLSELEDMQLVNKLDIINVKNELDKASFASGPSPETSEKVDMIEKDLEEFKSVFGKGKPVKDGSKEDSNIEGIASEISYLKERIGGLEKKGKDGTEPVKVSSGELAGVQKEITNMKKKISALGTRKPPSDQKGLMERVELLEAAVSDDVEKTTADLAKMKSGTKKVSADTYESINEMKDIIQSVNEVVKAQGQEIANMKSDKKGAHNLEKLDELDNELSLLKSQVTEVEKNAAKFGMAPDALEELRNFKGQFPVEEYHELKKRMNKIEMNLGEVGKLAAGLKPIEMPKSESQQFIDKMKMLEKKVEDLEKLAGEGVSASGLKNLMKRLEETREWVPDYVSKDVGERVEEFRKEIEEKVHEVDQMKEEIVGHTVEQLLAQPGNVSRLLGDKLKKQLDELKQRIEKLDKAAKPSDAKLTMLLRDFDSAKNEIEKEKLAIKELQDKSKGTVGSLAVEMNALKAKLDSLTGAGVNKKSSGKEATDVPKNLEKELKILKAIDEKNRSEMKSLASEVSTLSARIDSLGKPGKPDKKPPAPPLSEDVLRDLEILKTKADWLESTIHKLDLNHLYQKIDDLEDRIKSSSGSSHHGAIVLE